MTPPFYDASKTGIPSPAYICWLDVMGSKSNMLRSLKQTENFVMKLHITALEALPTQTAIELFPVIDGIYIWSDNQTHLLKYVGAIFVRLADAFVSEPNMEHKSMIRGAIAYGPVIRGSTLSAGSPVLQNHKVYCDRILLGIPLVQAYVDEAKASPFGLYVHESARAFSPTGNSPIPLTHLPCWTNTTTNQVPTNVAAFKQSLDGYFAWCEAHSTTILYEKDAVTRHKTLANEYFQ